MPSEHNLDPSPEYTPLVEKPFAGKATPWLKKMLYCFRLLFFGALLPIPVAIVNAALQLITLQPLQAIKSLIGGVVATASLVLIAIVGMLPYVLNRITSNAFCSGDYIDFINQDTVKTIPVKDGEKIKGEIKRYFIKGTETSSSEEIDKCSIVFLGTVATYAHHASKNSDRHRYIFHYPGVDKSVNNNYRLECSADAVNAGIAVVYDLINEKKWTKEEIRKNLLLEGHSLGGGVAYQVALHFKKEHQIDIPVDGQNTFWSIRAVLAGQLKRFLNTPLWCGQFLSGLILTAAGGFELDTLDAALQLDPNCVNFNNVRYEKDADWENKSVFKKIYNFEYQPLKAVHRYFWGSPHHDADYVLTDSATLYEGMKSRAKEETQTTTLYFAALGISDKNTRRDNHTWTVNRNGYEPASSSSRKKWIGYFVKPYNKGFFNHQRRNRSDDVRLNNKMQKQHESLIKK